MKVILLENVKRIGSIGEVIDVKRGFARNYLISNKKALYASKENIKEVERIKTELNKKDQEKKKNGLNLCLQNYVKDLKVNENKPLLSAIYINKRTHYYLSRFCIKQHCFKLQKLFKDRRILL